MLSSSSIMFFPFLTFLIHPASCSILPGRIHPSIHPSILSLCVVEQLFMRTLSFHSSFIHSIIHPLLVLRALPVVTVLSNTFPPPSILHFSSKPSSISVCFRAVSSTNFASTFSCSAKGFRAGRRRERKNSFL